MYFYRYFVWLKYIICELLLVPVLTTNYKQHILSQAEVTEVCYSLVELNIKLFV
jgi:hypothetical protein